MNRKRILLIAVVVVLLGCVVGIAVLSTRSGNDSDAVTATNGTVPSLSMDNLIPNEDNMDTTDQTDPIEPTSPTNATEPIVPSEPSDPTISEGPSEPMVPTPPVENPQVSQKVEILVNREDGSYAQGAAVIATHSSGWQEFEPTDEMGIAVLSLPEGAYSLRVVHDGQQALAQLEVSNQPVKKNVSLKDERKLYVLFDASGKNPEELASYSILVDAIKAQYPYATYITPEERYRVDFRDGDGLLSVEIMVENYASGAQYFAGEMRASFCTYQECFSVWKTDELGEEIEAEYADGNLCSIKVRNEYDYEYKNGDCIIGDSKYYVQKDWHLSRYSTRADAWGYRCESELVASTGTERWLKAPGAGKEINAFWYTYNENRFRDYLVYMEELFPYVDLWMSEDWNEEIEQFTSAL